LTARDVLKGQEDLFRLSSFRLQLPSVQQHCPVPDSLELMFHSEILNARLLRKNLLQKIAECRNVPLPVGRLLKRLTLGLIRLDLEGAIE
jgi:hypothetical protein